MKDGQKQYRILRIDEPDFGCEGRDDGEAAYDEITLVNEQGETLPGAHGGAAGVEHGTG